MRSEAANTDQAVSPEEAIPPHSCTFTRHKVCHRLTHLSDGLKVVPFLQGIQSVALTPRPKPNRTLRRIVYTSGVSDLSGESQGIDDDGASSGATRGLRAGSSAERPT